jgi:hypothetical protein
LRPLTLNDTTGTFVDADEVLGACPQQNGEGGTIVATHAGVFYLSDLSPIEVRARLDAVLNLNN